MVRLKVTAPYWCTYGAKKPDFSPPKPEPSRKSLRLQKQKESKVQPVNPQPLCPFYTLPTEIRHIIFELALTSYEDTSRPLDIKATMPHKYRIQFQYRPGHFCHRRTDTALLRTCRRVHEETSLLPAAVNAHELCFKRLSYPIPISATNYFDRMTPAQLAAVRHLHIFSASHRLYSKEGGSYKSHNRLPELGYLRDSPSNLVPPGLCGPYPRILTITLRHTDPGLNYSLEYSPRKKQWENVFGGVKVLRIELEVCDADKELLKPTVQRLKNFAWDFGNGKVLIAEEKVHENTWTHPVDRGTLDMPECEEYRFYVAMIVWKARRTDQL